MGEKKIIYLSAKIPLTPVAAALKYDTGNISVYKHCFCYSNVPTTWTKDLLFR